MRLWYAVGSVSALAVALVAVQLFRYQYVAASAAGWVVVYRADRLTGRACMVAPRDRCSETPAPTPTSPEPCPTQRPGESAVDAFIRCGSATPAP